MATDDELNRIPRLPKRSPEGSARSLPPVAIYRQEANEAAGVMGATILDLPWGPKAYARIWDHAPERIEWGWTLHPSAVEVWRDL